MTAPRPRLAPDAGDEPASLGDDGVPRRVHGPIEAGARCPGMPAATEDAGQDGRIDATGLRPDADPRGRAGLLEQDRHLGRLGLREEVDDALRVRPACAPVASTSASVSVDHTIRPVIGALEAVEDPAEQAQLGLGLRPIQLPRDIGQRRAGLHEGRRRRRASGASRSDGRRSRCP